jgi:hypothetical protein
MENKKRLTHDQEILLKLEVSRNASITNILLKNLETISGYKSTHEITMAISKLQEAIVWIRADTERIQKEIKEA